jgi:phosphate/sulfate permease
MGSELLLVIVVVTALAFDFTNGFHDTANAMATSIATGALRPRVAVGVAALMNLIGAFLSIKVATTIATDRRRQGADPHTMVFAALIYAQAREGDVVSRGASVLLTALGGVLCAAALIVGFIALTKK